MNSLNIDDFEIRTLEDEIRADQECPDLLRALFEHLITHEQLQPEEAGTLCAGADHFLREFVIPDCRENLFRINPERVRQFAGNWYIVKTLEPNMVELERILGGIDAFYRFAGTTGLVSCELIEKVSEHCRELDFYRQRIEDFWALTENGYHRWLRQCPLG